MATYGKRKKGLLSSFTVFQDDKPEKETKQQQRSTYARLERAKSKMQRSRSRAQDDESSIDELAGNELLNTVPHEPVRLPSLHSLAAMSTTDILRPKSSRSTKTVPDDSDKPLPPIPRDPFAEQRLHWQNRPPLAKKTTNMKASDPGKVATKSKISSPIMVQPESSPAGPSPSRPATSHTSQSTFGTQPSTADATNFSKKISNLMQQAAAQESQTKQKAAIYAAESAKLSPLEKGKKAFVKATRAIKERLSSSSSSNDKPFNSRRMESIERSSSGGWEPPPQYESQEELTRGRLDRRIAEGENLSNPKIRKLTGDGNIPRKPLPVYESMRSRSQHSESDNPFSEADDEDGHLSPEDYSGFDFDFSRRKHKGKAVRAPVPVVEQVDSPSGQSDQHLTVPKSTSRFSNMISGLAQHSDTEYFSSSPVGYSTPRIRLEPQPPMNGNNTAAGALQRSPSILEFSFEGQSEDASSEAQSPKRRASEGSTSVKRKGATKDLRSQVAPVTKKLKTDSISSKDEGGLAAGISHLATEDDRGLLSLESTNAVVAKPSRNPSKRKGMSIFDLSKGKFPEGTGEDEAKRPWAHAIASKRSLVTRPSSVLFSRGRESRAGMQRLEQIDGDDMDVDELQTNDVTFHVGGQKN
ncbi:hypothetical protein HO133_010740 [Letharia lupina]|uniref:Uncharacterized protein n=1 Tax=Letharia lupina TaxID=560253 RepID=A0A8H6FDK6_9LECA|nr:uncharacterized protein HO133_010740 [Letharia lupina]KAF6224166.1 hypothetical protein HO133_010740 [Letharia lupina]